MDRLIICVKWRVKCSSLIEVIIALIIISVIFSLSITIYLNLQRTGWSMSKLQHQILMDKVYNELRFGQTDAEIKMDEVIVYINVKPHSSIDALKIIHLEVRTEEGKLVAEKKHLVYEHVEK
ncbi:hypothetical protein [Chryseosolibacter indicus]|uniref:Type II secretion system protein n=1 Tax=Chryseosolibacter indicus TaxID=2782351 RepID=A0ABS5VX10_9BACT|nr:hypothetical protein [Chryseosolibacter indicus]MBT1705382.1 hypothetical protein [Chryseosolibacter indicus]